MGFLSDLLDKLLGNKETVIATRKADSSPIRSSVKESTEKAGDPISYKDAVSYEHIKREFGDGFLFSPEVMQVSEREVDLFTSGSRHNIEEKYCGTNIAIFESTKYKTIVRLSLSIPTFDSGDREYDSWHDLFLLQEHNGIIRAVYCTGGYRVAHVEGYAQVYEYPEPLKKYFQDVIPENNSLKETIDLPARKEPRFKLGEGFYFEFDEVSNGMGGYRMINVYLLKIDDPSFKHCIVDESGMIENFPGIVDGDWKNELEFPLGKKTQFRFWIYAYKDGKASVEWTLQPDGRYFADGDGFGGENCEEITLWSYIDTNGFFTEPFKHR